MPKLIYTPKALDDLQGIKTYISRQFGADRAKICVREIATTVRQLEMFPDEGPCLQDLIEYSTDLGFPSDIIWNPAGLTSRTGSIPVAGIIFERNTAYSENVVVLFL